MGAWPDATRRHMRVTFRSGGGVVRFEGRWSVIPGGKLRGQRLEDGAPGEVTSHVAIVDPADVIKVERENPVYGTWELAP